MTITDLKLKNHWINCFLKLLNSNVVFKENKYLQYGQKNKFKFYAISPFSCSLVERN